MPQQLFDGSDSDNDDISKIKIDEEYARRFEHNKRREDLHRFEELKKKGVISSPSSSRSEGDEDESESESSDDDDNEILNSRSDKEFFDALLKVKKQDPVLKEKDVRLFMSDHSSDEESDEKVKKAKGKKEEKPMYLKDVMAKHLIEEGPDFGDEEEEINERKKGKSGMSLIPKGPGFANKDGKKTYHDEQEELKRAVREAVEREGLEDGDEGFFTVKENSGEDKVDNEDKEFEEKLNEFFGGDDVELNENSRFLKNYFMNKMWIDKSGKSLNIGEEELQEISEDEMEIEKQEEYEYRFQENPEDRVLGHARKVEGSVRKKTNTRKEQRKSKEERMAAAQKEREQELKHLKNVKKQEIQEKVKTIMKTAGINDDDLIPLSTAEIEDEFDPEEYDRMMRKAFDEKYYNAEDVDPGFCGEDDDDMEKPDFEKEDELLGLPKGWDEDVSDGEDENTDDHDLQETEDETEDETEEKISDEGSRKRKRKTALLEKARQAMMDEYYKLDYEDTIGDLKTRFKYTKTKPGRFGLSAPEILVMDDKELNQYISLKKLAPYREEDWKLSKLKRYQLKMRTRELIRAANLNRKKNKKSTGGSGKLISSKSVVEKGKASTEESNINMENRSRKARRRRAEKISESRQRAYGKIPSKSKRRGKH